MCALQEVSHSLVSKARTVSHLHLTNDYISLVRTIMISCHCEFLSQKDKRAISASHWALLCSERANQGGRFWIILHQVPEGVMGICEQEHVLRIFKGQIPWCISENGFNMLTSENKDPLCTSFKQYLPENFVGDPWSICKRSSNFHEKFPKWGEKGKAVFPAQKKLQFYKIPALFDNKHAVKAQLFFSDYINRKI